MGTKEAAENGVTIKQQSASNAEMGKHLVQTKMEKAAFGIIPRMHCVLIILRRNEIKKSSKKKGMKNYGRYPVDCGFWSNNRNGLGPF